MARHDPLARIVGRLANAIAAVVAITVPLGFWAVSHFNLAESLGFKAQVKATALSSLIASHPDTWMYAENRMQGLINRVPVKLERERVEVFDGDGARLVHAGEDQPAPAMQRAYPLYDADRVVGSVVVTRSVRYLLAETMYAGFAGVCLGLLVLFGLRTVPMSALRRVSRELYDEKERAETTLGSIGDAVITTDAEQVIVYANPVAESMLQRTAEALTGRRLSDVLHLIDEDTGDPVPSALDEALQTRAVAQCNRSSALATPNGEKLSVEEIAAPMFDPDGRLSGAVVCLRDVTAAREFLQIRSWEATHDLLTGIANRREFESRVNAALTNAKSAGQSHVLCFMDLDRFKIVNDTCGHAAGDKLLIEIAELMQNHVRASDTLARLGGDEFGMLLTGCNLDRGELIASDILSAVSDHQFPWDGQVFTVGLSVGLTLITIESFSAAEAMGEADSACYWAKEQGRNRVCVFRAGDAELAARRSEVGWVARITSALNENRFVLYHQTYRALTPAAGSRLHLEVLLRMIESDGRIFTPGQFLPAAERYNLMPQIDRWVIESVFSGFDRIGIQYPGESPVVNINLSGASIASVDLVEFIRDALSRHRIDPSSICFEVTETVAVKHLRTAIEVISECKKMGLTFALDDFGTGTSSFGYLKNLPVDYLKIDGSFVNNLPHDSVDRAMTEAINRIGHLMGKVTVGEFAADETVIAELRAIGVDFAQGYGVCKPIPLFPAAAWSEPSTGHDDKS